MPRLHGFIQEPIPLYPVVEELDRSRGAIRADLSDLLPHVQPDTRMKLGRLAGLYGRMLGPTDGLDHGEDIILEVNEEDFARAEPKAIEYGLYVATQNWRFSHSDTEQLVTIRPPDKPNQPGVVFPAEEFHVVARSPLDLAKHAMAQSRKANANNLNRAEVDEIVGRAAGHAMEGKILYMNKLEKELLENRAELLIPLYRDTHSYWRSHFKAKNLDKKRHEFDEQLHDIIETATINLDLSSSAVKAVHRATTSAIHRRGSTQERNNQLRKYIKLVGTYTVARLVKIDISRRECQAQLAHYQPFLDAKAQAAA